MEREVFVQLGNAECMDGQPKPVYADGFVIGHALWNKHLNTHVLELKQADFLKHARALALGAMMPFSRWYVIGIRIVDDVGETEERLMAQLEEKQGEIAALIADRDCILSRLKAGSGEPEKVPVPFVAPVAAKKKTYREWRKDAKDAGVPGFEAITSVEGLQAAIAAHLNQANAGAA